MNLRRKIIISGLLPFAPIASNASDAHSQERLTFLTASSLQFDAAISTHFPGLQSAKHYESLKPFLAVGIASAGSPVDALTLRWIRFRKGKKKESYKRRISCRPAGVAQLKNKSTLALLIPTGQAVLFSPTFWWSEKFYADKFVGAVNTGNPLAKSRLTRFASRYPRASGFMKRSALTDRIEIVVEASIINGVASPTRAGASLSKLVRDQRVGELDAAIEIMSGSMRSGAIDLHSLENIATRDRLVAFRSSRSDRHYARARARLSAKALQLAHTGDTTSLLRVLEAAANYSRL